MIEGDSRLKMLSREPAGRHYRAPVGEKAGDGQREGRKALQAE